MSLKDAKNELLAVLGGVSGLPAISTEFGEHLVHTEEATFIAAWGAEYEYEVLPPTEPSGNRAMFLVGVQIKRENMADPEEPVDSLMDMTEAIRQAFEANAASGLHLMVTDEDVTMLRAQDMGVIHLTIEVSDFAPTV